MYNFESFVKQIRSCCRINVRISDDVLEEADWGINELTIVDNTVVGLVRLSHGAYRVPDMMGWTTDMIVEWSSYDPTGRHPEQYNEVSLG